MLLERLLELFSKKEIKEIEFIPIETKMPEPIEEPKEKLNDKLVRIADALTLLKTDITPKDKIPDEVACVENVCEVINKIVPFPILSYTPDFVRELKKDTRFEATLDFNEATIIVCATGTGNGTMRGHCGIIGTGKDIISNNSKTGIWEYNYTIETWKQRFRIKGGMPILLFKLKE